MSEIVKDSPVGIQEVAHYLDIPKSTVYKLAKEGSIPGFKIGKHWRFYLTEIDLQFRTLTHSC